MSWFSFFFLSLKLLFFNATFSHIFMFSNVKYVEYICTYIQCLYRATQGHCTEVLLIMWPINCWILNIRFRIHWLIGHMISHSFLCGALTWRKKCEIIIKGTFTQFNIPPDAAFLFLNPGSGSGLAFQWDLNPWNSSFLLYFSNLEMKKLNVTGVCVHYERVE